MPSIYLRGANTTAQWYADNYSGATFSRLDKFLIHTTETGGWPGYSAGASAPNATYYPKFRQIRQHFGINRSARALRDPSSTAVRENRDNVFQLEIICYSDYALARSRGGIWVGDLTDSHMRDIAAMILQIHTDWGLPMQSSVTWREGRTTWYDNVRLSGGQFDAYRGILGHVHASGNTHWDPGGFRYSKLVKALNYQLVNHPVYGGGVTIPGGSTPSVPDITKDWFDMADKADLAEVVEAALVKTRGTFPNGNPINIASPGGTIYAWEGRNASRDALTNQTKILTNQAKQLTELASIRAAVNGDPVDEGNLAHQLAPLLAPVLVSAVVAELGGETGVSAEQVEEINERVLRRVLGSLAES